MLSSTRKILNITVCITKSRLGLQWYLALVNSMFLVFQKISEKELSFSTKALEAS